MTLKSKINSGELSIGSWITLSHPAIAEIFSKAGFDWLAVDLEHSVITIKEAEELIRVISLYGITPLVRLTSNNSDQIKRVMDAGSHGVIVPMVNSAEDALAAIKAVKYPPQGYRGFGLARAQSYGHGFNDYLDWQQKNSIVIVQIEHIDAVKNLESIFSIKDVDGFIIGPYDLSGSMGIAGQFNHPDLLKVMTKIQKIGTKYNKAGGIHIVEPSPSELKLKIEEGHKFIAYSVDIRMLDRACREGLNIINK